MIPAIDYIRPRTLDEALSALSENHGNAAVLAGGTDIVPGLQQGSRRFASITKLIDIGAIPELKAMDFDGQLLRIGAGITFSELSHDPLVRENFPLLTEAAQGIGSVQIRNRATIGGNCCNNAPCADSVPPLLVYEARLRILSHKSERIVWLQDFLLKPYHTQLQPDEILVQIILPSLPKGYWGKFYKLGRRRGVAISRITLALLIKVGADVIEDIRLASGAVTPIGVRFHELEAEARGKPCSDELFRHLAARLGQAILEKTGLRWSTAYKLPVVQQMFYQLLEPFKG